MPSWLELKPTLLNNSVAPHMVLPGGIAGVFCCKSIYTVDLQQNPIRHKGKTCQTQ